MIQTQSLTWCVACADLGASTPATDSIKVAFGVGQQLVVGLCDRHVIEVVDPLFVLLERHGLPVVL